MKKQIILILIFFTFFSNAQTPVYWRETGNAVGANKILGTTNSQSLSIRTNSVERINISPIGVTKITGTVNAVVSGSTILIVDQDGVYSLGASGVVGNDVTAYGSLCLPVSTGIENSAFGRGAMLLNTTGGQNSVFGQTALLSNLTGSANCIFGKSSGFGALSFRNNFFGATSGFGMTSGNQNVGIGTDVLRNAAGGSSNVAVGNSTFFDLTGNLNTGIGFATGQGLITGVGNTFIGSQISLGNVSNNVAISNGTGQVVYRDNGTNSYNLRALRIGSTIAPNAILDVNGDAIISSSISAGGLVLSAGSLTVTSKILNTTSGDAATINSPTGSFRKDNSGTIFVLTNSFITANSVIIPAIKTIGITSGYFVRWVCTTGSVTFIFETNGVAAAPNIDCDVNFYITN